MQYYTVKHHFTRVLNPVELKTGEEQSFFFPSFLFFRQLMHSLFCVFWCSVVLFSLRRIILVIPEGVIMTKIIHANMLLEIADLRFQWKTFFYKFPRK